MKFGGWSLSWTLWFFCITFSLLPYCYFALQLNLKPRRVLNAAGLGWKFSGNHSKAEHFKLLEIDQNSLLVGARNAVYNLSLADLSLQRMLKWPSTDQDVSMCKFKGKTEQECQNYVRVLVKQVDGQFLVCGTNAFNPRCRQYEVLQDGTYDLKREFSGFAISPYDPKHNSSFLYVPETSELYTATVSDFSGFDPLIYRKPLSKFATEELRTKRNDLTVLNEPNFVSSTQDSQHVYLWFREQSSEFSSCGKCMYARVARVCKRDRGGPHVHADMWTTFLKARLNCSIPGEYEFNFDALQATSNPVVDARGDEVVYVVFTTPYEGLQASAVCAFRMSDVRAAFDAGSFEKSPHDRSPDRWSTTAQKVPKPRPGACSKNSKKLNSETLNFVHNHPLMHEPISNAFREPLLVDTNFEQRFTQIAVDAGVRSVDGKTYDVLFLGTDDGKILKMINTANQNEPSAVQSTLIESIEIFRDWSPVRNLLIHDSSLTGDSRKSVIAVSDREVRSIPVEFCANATSCTACLRLQDPYCAWDLNRGICTAKTDGSWLDDGRDYVQAIETGYSKFCPEGEYDPTLYAINELYPSRSVSPLPLIYTSNGMAIAVILTLVGALTVGFLAGFNLSRKGYFSRLGSSAASSVTYCDSAVTHGGGSSMLKSRLTSSTGVTGTTCGGHQLENIEAQLYETPPQHAKLNEAVSLVLSMHEASLTKSERSAGEKNQMPILLNNGTLPRDYKAKKVYL